MKRLTWLIACLLCFSFISSRGAGLPALSDIPNTLTDAQKRDFSEERRAIEEQYRKYSEAGTTFNKKTAEEQTSDELAALLVQQQAYINAANSFNEKVQDARFPGLKGRASRASVPVADVIKGMDAMAGTLGWPAKKRAHLNVILNALKSGREVVGTSEQIKKAWKAILARKGDAVFASEAASGHGPDLSGAGTQTDFNDCAVFALSAASDRPYGFVAARAASLIRDGEWNDPVERAHPDQVIGKWGIYDLEIVMMSEILGRADVVTASNFGKVLQQNHPIMVGVVSENGDMDGGHEVVLTRSFQHGGQTWYAVMDSNQGPARRLYASSKELDLMIQDNGVTFRPDVKATPQLLRKKGHR